jgi:hypothetical protein
MAAASCLWFPAAAFADPVIGQVDTFQDGTTQSWQVGGAAPPAALPVNVDTGGPAGAGDRFLRLTALGGNGPGSKLSVFNGAQWTGNYLGAGVGSLTMDLRNFGPSDLYLRLLFLGPFGPTGPTSLAFSTEAVFLPSGGDWTPVTFRIGTGDLTADFGTTAEALSGASELRLFHNPDPFFNGPGGNAIPSVQASLGVDNIRAVAIPEPGTLALLATGGLLPLTSLVANRRRRRIRPA